VSIPTFLQDRAKRHRASGLIIAALLLTSGRLEAKPLSTNDVAEICWDAGFRDTGLTKAIAVAWAESSFDPKAQNKNKDGSTDYGLFQFNSVAHKEVSKSMALDPKVAAQEAFRVTKGGKNWGDWKASYQGPKYNKKFDEAKEATALITAIKTINRDAQALSDIKKQASKDWRFGALKDSKTKFEKEEDGYEFRSARVRWLLVGENKIWHITLKSDPRVRYTNYYDPLKGAFTPWLRH
jgi:Lysozyme like domain